jgi:hypothetical protein
MVAEVIFQSDVSDGGITMIDYDGPFTHQSDSNSSCEPASYK